MAVLFKFLQINTIMLTSPQTSNKKSLVIICGILAAIGISLFAYLMWYVSPDVKIEQVKIISVTADGCIAETPDGFPVNIGSCDAEVGEFISAPIDQKTKERQALMNPTT